MADASEVAAFFSVSVQTIANWADAGKPIRTPSGHIALGAQFTLVGRVYLYGLMAGGRDSVDRTIQMLSEQVGRTMRLLGVATVDELTPTHVTQLAPQAPPPPAASAPTLGGDLSWH